MQLGDIGTSRAAGVLTSAQLMLLQLVVEFNIGAGCELVAGEILAWFG